MSWHSCVGRTPLGKVRKVWGNQHHRQNNRSNIETIVYRNILLNEFLEIYSISSNRVEVNEVNFKVDLPSFYFVGLQIFKSISEMIFL